MRKTIYLLVIALGIGLLFSACKEKTEEEKMLDDIEKLISALENEDLVSANRYRHEFEQKYDEDPAYLNELYKLDDEKFLDVFTSGNDALKPRVRKVFRRLEEAREKNYDEK